MEWYELEEEDRIKEVYTKFSIADFFNWWANNGRENMEVRIKDFNIVKDTAKSLELSYSASGVYVNNSSDLKSVISRVRDKTTCWFGINPRKANWNKWGNKSLGGSLTNIGSINFLFIDIDRLIKQQPATKDELKNANALAEKIIERLGTQGWNNNYCKICSGNGIQLLIKLDYPIKMPHVEYDKSSKEYKITEEFNNYVNIMRNKIGKQLLAFSNKYTDELKVSIDRACFNLAGVGALPVTKNYKYNGYTWRGIIEIQNKGENTGLTDYILSGLTPSGKANVFASKGKTSIVDALRSGKLREHPLVKFMLQDLPVGDRNNKLWFSFKCLVRDSKIDMNSKEFRELHAELEKIWKDILTLNLPDKKFQFSRNTINNWCIEHLIQPLYPLWEERIAKRRLNIENIDIDAALNTDIKPLSLGENTTIHEDMEMFDTQLVDIPLGKNSTVNQAKYIGFLKSVKEKYGEEKMKFYAQYVFLRYFCWK